MSKKKEELRVPATRVVMTIWGDGDSYHRRTEINLDCLLRLIMDTLGIKVEYHNEEPSYYSIEKKEKK